MKEKFLKLTAIQWAALAVISTFVSPLIFQYWNEISKTADIKIDDIRYDGNIAINRENYIQFRVYNQGEVKTGPIRFYYQRLNQIKNSCGNNITFFNSSEYMCFFQIIGKESQQGYCNVDISPLSTISDAILIKQNLINEKDFFLRNPKISNCTLIETIIICGTDGKYTGCSLPNNITLKIE